MSIAVACSCGKTYNLKDELAGKVVKCPACGAVLRIPVPAGPSPQPSTASPAAAPAARRPLAPSPPPLQPLRTAPPPVMSPPPAGMPSAGGLPPLRGAPLSGAMVGAAGSPFAVGHPLQPPSPYRSPASLQSMPMLPEQPGASPFDRDKFLLRQKHLSLNQKYYVWNEQGASILFVERPTHVWASLLALLGALVAAFVIMVAGMLLAAILSNKVSDAAGGAVVAVTIFLAICAAVSAAIVLSPKRHVHFYLDDTKSQEVLQILQDKKFTPINATYTVLDTAGNLVAKLHKNYLYNFFRKRWYVYAPDGSISHMALEDSIVLSMLRRLFGPMYGLLRTNFVIVRGQSEDEIGQFNRKFTLLDRYVLDMSGDPQRTFDRRIALALGVMLDTGERR